ncbi:ribosomal RNA small subunit methyltransferase I [Striga asiatica]|uniref:Ribosomal RNA small subunit methyltransferase I n=1 Tax=Striga asiatica TaxID=4170 RepID=A0A5A7Q036_STRAF|nr:ribosomal RNA small subunit methyltransferase I [Striga asiatica]
MGDIQFAGDGSKALPRDKRVPLRGNGMERSYRVTRSEEARPKGPKGGNRVTGQHGNINRRELSPSATRGIRSSDRELEHCFAPGQTMAAANLLEKKSLSKASSSPLLTLAEIRSHYSVSRACVLRIKRLEQNCRISYIFVRYTGLADPEIAGVSKNTGFDILVKYLPICGATRLLCLWDFQLNTNTNTRLGEQYHLKLSLATYARPLDIGWEPPEYLMLVGSTLTWMLSLRLADETPKTSLPKTLVWVPQGHVGIRIGAYRPSFSSESGIGHPETQKSPVSSKSVLSLSVGKGPYTSQHIQISADPSTSTASHDSQLRVIVDAIDSSLAANNSNLDNSGIQAIMPIISQPDHELIKKMESNISLFDLPGDILASLPRLIRFLSPLPSRQKLSSLLPLRQENQWYRSREQKPIL